MLVNGTSSQILELMSSNSKNTIIKGFVYICHYEVIYSHGWNNIIAY